MSDARSQFVKVPFAVIDHSDLDAAEMLVYITLLRYRNHETGIAFPGLRTIADGARQSVNSTRRAIARLENKGILKVERVKAVGAKTNAANRYQVGLLPEDFMAYVGSSAKGKRIPKRKLSDSSRERLSEAAKRGNTSEALPKTAEALSSASEALGNASEASGVTPPRHGNKLYLNKINEQDITLTFSESEQAESSVYFSEANQRLATAGQISYLRDLVVLLSFDDDEMVLDELLIARWGKFSRSEAGKQIQSYRRRLGPLGGREYPQPGETSYDLLSTAGKAFADSNGDPASFAEWGAQGAAS